ncbi:MAG: PilZ domain-containing protein, partial [Pseudomonadales bacterium]|nr:PilZ domain-containing protein [Pseudomonadales bacterium]
MNASNDSFHNDIDKERRQRFRVDDTAILEVCAVDVQDTSIKPAASFFKSSAPFNLVRDIHDIDQEHAAVLRSLGEKNPELALYLGALNKKIESIGSAVAESILPEDQRLQAIDLSEGGIGFVHDVKLVDGAYYALKIWFHRALIGITAYVRVVGSNRSIEGGYHISAAFHAMPDAESQIIARHIYQVQAEQQRSRKS